MNLTLNFLKAEHLLQKAVEGQRISQEEAMDLFNIPLHELGAAAEEKVRKLYGNQIFYVLNRFINYTNYCILNCPFCAFARRRDEEDGFELSLEQIEQKVKEALSRDIVEVHIVGGLHPVWPFDYYVEMIKRLRALSPRLCLKCFTAIEILHFSRISGKSPVRVLEILKEAGLDMLTGGGAEIFHPDIRSKIAKQKESAQQWLEIHRQWHLLGGKSTCTMLFGHIEKPIHRIDHLIRLRKLQDETSGFVGFIPLPYYPKNNFLGIKYGPTGIDILKTFAISRLVLDNIAHITAYWVSLGVKLAQLALHHGASDLHGTVEEEYVFHMAGVDSPMYLSEQEIIHVIHEIGKVPVRRDSHYRALTLSN